MASNIYKIINSFDIVVYMEISMDLLVTWQNYKIMSSFDPALYMKISMDYKWHGEITKLQLVVTFASEVLRVRCGS